MHLIRLVLSGESITENLEYNAKGETKYVGGLVGSVVFMNQ